MKRRSVLFSITFRSAVSSDGCKQSFIIRYTSAGRKKSEPSTPIHVTRKDSGELGDHLGNGHLGQSVHLPKRGSSNSNLGEDIDIPLNNPRTSSEPPRLKFTTTSRPLVTKILSSSDRHPSANCPNRVGAYTFGPGEDYLFSEDKVYIVKNDRIISSDSISKMFPSGPRHVNAAVYDQEREILVVIEEKSVYGYKRKGSDYKLESVYPKELPSSIAFTPNAAIRWHDKHQMLLSNGGMFALYDEYWNKSLMTGRSSSYFKNLPDRVRGISEWKNGKANIYTQSLVFIYDVARDNVAGEGVSVPDFLRC
ncbi:unnamed protein product [Caenorhabditis auriculariae]|uniref:Uncharacterized protein n=1 Tax=Caenorhabditis auriculariae TaxID=2777116 RepID=A0A8S1HUR1_9PELO|nr:unnamed protein product [Caenorhabditis auriculariae]